MGGGVIGSSEGSESGQIDSKRNHENFYSHSTFQYSRARRRPLHCSQNAILISDKQQQGACPPHRTSGGVFRVMQRECFGQSRIPTRRCLRANAANYRSQDDHVFDGQGARGRVQRSLHPAVGWLGVCQQGGGSRALPYTLTCTETLVGCCCINGAHCCCGGWGAPSSACVTTLIKGAPCAPLRQSSRPHTQATYKSPGENQWALVSLGLIVSLQWCEMNRDEVRTKQEQHTQKQEQHP